MKSTLDNETEELLEDVTDFDSPVSSGSSGGFGGFGGSKNSDDSDDSDDSDIADSSAHRHTLIIAAGAALVLLVVIVLGVYNIFLKSNKTFASDADYYQGKCASSIPQSSTPATPNPGLAYTYLCYDTTYVKDTFALCSKDNADDFYLPLSLLNGKAGTGFDQNRFYWDSESGSLRYCHSDRCFEFLPGQNIYYVRAGVTDSTDMSSLPAPQFPQEAAGIGPHDFSKTYLVFDSNTQEYYLHKDIVNMFLSFAWETGDDPRMTVIVPADSSLTFSVGNYSPSDSEDILYMRTAPNRKEPQLHAGALHASDPVICLTQMKNWYLISTFDGYTGYVPASQITVSETKNPYLDKVSESTYSPLEPIVPTDGKIVALWHQTLGEPGLESLPGILEKARGLEVICPTFFQVSDNAGSIESVGTVEYVQMAHENGLKVWGMVDNLNIPIDSGLLLASADSRSTLIKNLIDQADALGLDGINLDFESLNSSCADDYIEFVRELSIECHNNDLTFSVDNYAPSASTAFYDRTEQSFYADYVVVMAYNEHWGGANDTPGSTASLPFVKAAIEDTIAEVPAGQVICGLPFYTRVWNGNDGTTRAIGMNTSNELMATYDGLYTWQADIGQYHLSYMEDGVPYEVWLEDVTSGAARLDLASQYPIAGVSFWKSGFDDEGIWEKIREYHDK